VTDVAPGNGWLRSGRVEVLLPSGYEVRVVLPSLRHLVRHAILPRHLHEAALHGADPEWLRDPDHHADRQARVGEYMAFLVSWAIREERAPGGEWAPVTYSAEDIARADQRDDMDLLEDLVLRTRSASEVTLRSRQLRGEETMPAVDVTRVPSGLRATIADLVASTGRSADEVLELAWQALEVGTAVDEIADAIRARMSEESIPGWDGFRAEPGGPAAREGGAPLGDAAEPPAGAGR